MDVTRVHALALLSYVHLTIATYSGYIWTTPLLGKMSCHVIQHCLHTSPVMGWPQAPLLTLGHDYAAVLTPTGPLWIPAQCVRHRNL